MPSLTNTRTKQTKRTNTPSLTPLGQQALDRFGQQVRECEDLRPATVRNYVSDLRHFIAWCEERWQGDDSAEERADETPVTFAPRAVTTPTITTYRTFLQSTLGLRPASINRALISLKRYFAWAVNAGLIARDPAKVVKLVEQVDPPPRFLSDREEDALVAPVSRYGTLRDRTVLLLLLHTGLRAHEICHLRLRQVHLGKRSGTLEVIGKRGKYREVPLNATARAALVEYLPIVPAESSFLFPSNKTGQALSERGLGYLVRRYATLARLIDVSPHDLRHRFGYRMAASVPLHRLAQIMGHNSLDTTLLYVRGTKADLQREVEKIAWA
jgi:integrase/recombinase XerD